MSFISFFSRNPKPTGLHGAMAPKSAAKLLREHPNTPPSAFGDGSGEYAEMMGAGAVSNTRMFILGLLGFVVGIGALVTVSLLLPLKTIETHLVEVDPVHGVVGKPIKVENVTPNRAVVEAELAKWIASVYTLDQLRTNDNFKFAVARTRSKAIGQFTEFRNREQVYKRLQQETGLIREVKVRSVDASSTGLAFAFVNTEERVGRESEAKVKQIRLTLHYELDPPKNHTDLLANPLGIYVTFFNEAEERATR